MLLFNVLQPCSGYLMNDNDRICNVHNSVGGSQGRRQWVPISQQTYPCYVLCRDLSGNVPNEIKTDKEDGTKCGSENNFYCFKGECKVRTNRQALYCIYMYIRRERPYAYSDRLKNSLKQSRFQSA